jgi:hypothetical protein
MVRLGFAAGLGGVFPPIVALMEPSLEICVVGESGPIENANVQLSSVFLSMGRLELQTDSQGLARFGLSQPGYYDVFVNAEGFRPAVARDVYVSGGDASQVTLTLEAGDPGGGGY